MQMVQRDRRAELEEAAQQRALADQEAEAAGNHLIDEWTNHCIGLKQLGFGMEEALEQLVIWAASPEDSNPIHAALREAYSRTSVRHAGRQSEFEIRRKSLQQDRTCLIEEKDRLEKGHDSVPPLPATRGANVRESRAGARYGNSSIFSLM